MQTSDAASLSQVRRISTFGGHSITGIRTGRHFQVRIRTGFYLIIELPLFTTNFIFAQA
jgi:hypothetical protein